MQTTETKPSLLTPEDSRRVATAIISALDELMDRKNGQITDLIYEVGENVRRGLDEAINTGPGFVDAVRGAIYNAVLERGADSL